MSKIVSLTRSEFAENFLWLNGRQLSLYYYPHLRKIYDTNASEVVLMFSRQTAKSTTLANLMIANSAMIPGFRTLYVAPTVDQTKVFSHDRVAPVINSSPFIKRYFINSSLVQNVFMKQFINQSKMYLRYALLSADRLRGYSSDMNLFDESQDLRSDIIPVVQETMSRSMYKRSMYSGTPKRTQGTLASLWRRSTMNEYVIKCEACNHWNILDENNIGETGVVCKRCNKPISVTTGQWVSTYSRTQKPTAEGYRVCLLHFAHAPWVDWQRDVINKIKNFSRAYVHNEVLALEYDEGESPVTEEDIRACCSDKPMNELPDQIDGSYATVVGIDYGPINSEASYTIISCVQLRGDVAHVTYYKKFVGKEADYSYIHKEVPRIMSIWKSTHLAADYGMGEASNSEIRSRIGYEKVVAFQHLQGQKEKIRWNNKMPAYTLNRNQVMGDFFERIKKRKIVFPRWEDFQEVARDIKNVQKEFDEERNSMKYINIGPDDFVHATIFAIISLELLHGAQ